MAGKMPNFVRIEGFLRKISKKHPNFVLLGTLKKKKKKKKEKWLTDPTFLKFHLRATLKKKKKKKKKKNP